MLMWHHCYVIPHANNHYFFLHNKLSTGRVSTLPAFLCSFPPACNTLTSILPGYKFLIRVQKLTQITGWLYVSPGKDAAENSFPTWISFFNYNITITVTTLCTIIKQWSVIRKLLVNDRFMSEVSGMFAVKFGWWISYKHSKIAALTHVTDNFSYEILISK